MIERHLLALKLGCRYRRTLEDVIPKLRVRREHAAIVWIEIRHGDHVLERRELREDLPHFGLAIEALAAVLVAVDVEDDFRRELREAFENARRPEVRAAARPNRADTRCCEHCDDRL